MDYIIWPWDIPNEIGIVFAILVVPGLVALSRQLVLKRSSWIIVWATWTAALFIAFGSFGYLYRLAAKVLWGAPLTAFTPSRFLTDAVYPLALAAGWTLSFITTQLGRAGRIGQTVAGLWVVVLMLVVDIPFVQQQSWSAIQPDEMAMLQWIKNNTPSNAMMLGNPMWLEYVTWREGSNTPLPVSEPINDPSVVFKKETLTKMNSTQLTQWSKVKGRTVYLIKSDGEINETGWVQVFQSGHWRVAQLDATP